MSSVTSGIRRWLIVAVPAAGMGMALLLAGCSSGPAAHSTGTTTTSTSASAATTVTIATTIPFSEAKNARQDVATGACTDTGGVWELKGTVSNSASVARTYQIVVDFVSQPGDTVQSTTIVTTPAIAPRASRSWSAKSSAGLANVACVIRQVQAPA